MRQLKWLSLLGLLLLGPSTYAQSVRFQSQAISSRGAGIANATVAVCTQPSNTNTQPCSPLATLATSTSTTSGGANPLTADSFGNFFFYAAPGRYTVQIYGPAVSGQFVIPDVDIASTSNGATGSFSNLNNIRIIDGTKYTLNGAGINQAMTDLGSSGGEVWVTNGITATDAQITITSGHTLRVMANLTINAQSPGPILLGKYAHLTCQMPGGANGTGNILHVTGTAPVAMVQMANRDGSLETAYVDYCAFNAGGSAVTYSKGVIDATGMNDKGFIDHNIIYSYGGGWGLWIEDLQSGAQLGTSNMQFNNNWFTPGNGSAGCINITHSSTANIVLQVFEFNNDECQLAAGSSTIATAPVQITNSVSGGAGFMREMNFNNFLFQGVPVAQPSITINGLESATFKNIFCGGAGPCINIPNSGNNQGLIFEGITNTAGGNTLVDTNNSITLTNPTLSRYVYLNTNATTQTVGYVTAPETFSHIGNGAGLQFFNTTTTCTTGAVAGNSCTTANITLPATEADTSYRVVCTGRTATNFPAIVGITNVDTSHITISIATVLASAASFGSYDCYVGHN